MKYLVLGANGMAGHVITTFLREQGHDVTPCARQTTAFEDTQELDVRDTQALAGLITDGGYHAVVNCIGLLVQDSDRKRDEAAFINAYLPHLVASVTAGTDCKLVHLSTDCVFSGLRGPYAVDSDYDGQRFYDRSKALGEVDNEKDVTLRMSIIGPELSASGSGLFNWFAAQRGQISGFRRVLWNGITTTQLARITERVAQDGTTGIIHAVPDADVSKYQLLRMLKETFSHDVDVVPSDDYISDKRLLPNSVDVRADHYSLMLESMRQWVRDHRGLYPHYAHLAQHA